MKYLLFAGDSYYPSGGWKDFRGYFETVAAARIEGAGYDWSHVVDSDMSEIVPTKAEIVMDLRRKLYARAGQIENAIRNSTTNLAQRLILRAKMAEVKLIIDELKAVHLRPCVPRLRQRADDVERRRPD